VNWHHVRTFVWLRYRLRVNQIRRGGSLNAAIVSVFAVGLALASIGLFIAGVLVGALALPESKPITRLLVWDGIIAAFLLTWIVGLLTELQRTDALSLDKFLHLPVSPVGAFLVNYVSSLFSVNLLLFVPGMVGLLIGQTVAAGPEMLLAFPLFVAFLFALTALTYQFQGWIASLITSPRKRRTVVAAIMVTAVMLFQLPSFINIIRSREGDKPATGTAYTTKLQELDQSFRDGKIPLAEYQRKSAEAQREYQSEIQQSSQRDWGQVEETTRLINHVVPPAWLPLGVADLAAGSVIPALLGTLGYSLIGAFGLYRAYRTTLRLYTGYNTAGGGKAPAPIAATTDPAKLRLVEWQLPRISEPAAAVAAAGFRSLLRAPEAKMTLIAPVIIVVVFGAILFTIPVTIPVSARPLIAFGAIGMIFLGSLQLIGNQFGYDRGGFRVYVLSPVPRREILLGKNLASAPITLGLIPLFLIVLEIACPMRVDHFVASFFQAVGMYLLFCLLANVSSIYAPQAIASGAMKPSQTKLTPILVQFAVMIAFPISVVPYIVPLGLEVLIEEVADIRPLPIALPLNLLLFAGTVALYRRALGWLGQRLAAREQTILEIVTSRIE